MILNKISILLIGIIAFILYYFPIQKHYAEKKLDKYMSTQGVSKENIQSKKIFKDYKVNGYAIQIVYEDDPDYLYTYYYHAGTDSIMCIVYDNQDVEASNHKVKYPPIN